MEKQQFPWSSDEWRDPCSSHLHLLPDPTNDGLFFINNNTNQGDPFVESGFSPYKPNSPIPPPDIMNPNPNINITKLQGKSRASAAETGEGSSLSEQIIIGKKRKKETEEESKDYIHVRARRGQATDSHSLAERVRREKIGERMKFLQDLVPGCDKVTGKAVMLDEIINYVQSLQRQVEFLSMKMATVNPRSMEFNNMESLLLSKDNVSEGPIAAAGQQEKEEHQGFPNYSHHFGASNPIRRHNNQDVQMGLWNDDLQSVVKMGTLGLSQQPRH